MSLKIFTPGEVIRFLICGLLLTLLSNMVLAFGQSNTGSSAFSYNADDIKEPIFSYPELDADYNDLETIYNDTAELLYNSTGEAEPSNIHQVYPSKTERNYTNWFQSLLNNTGFTHLPQMFNFSGLFTGGNSSNKNSFYKLPETFKVFPSDRNFTIMHLKLPSQVSDVDADIFEKAFNDSPSNNNDKEIYINMPPIDSLSLNETENLRFLDQFFHTNTTTPLTSTTASSEYPTSAPSAQNSSTWISPTASLYKPTPNPVSATNAIESNLSAPGSSTPSVDDFLAKRIAQDETKNSTSFVENMLQKLGLKQITMDGDPHEPMYVYKLNTTRTNTGNSGNPQNYTIPKENFYFSKNGTNVPPLMLPPAPSSSSFSSLQNNQTISPFLPLPNINSTQSMDPTNSSSSWDSTAPIPIPYINSNGTGQNDLSYYGEPVNMAMNKTNTSMNVSFSAAVNDSVSDLYGEIVYTSVYFISGSSTPPKPYPKDPYSNATYWPEGIDELTNDGKNELYKLGDWLRERYKPLIGHQYNRSLISIESGASDIAISSAESLAAGLFPPKGHDIWNPLMLWQPTPVRSIPTTDDNMILMTKSCKQYDLQVKDLNNSPDWLQFYENNTETMNYIGENTGSNFTKSNLLDALQTIFYYYQDLTIEQENNLALPNWTSKVYPDEMKYLAEKYIEYAIKTRDLQKIKTGPFFKTIIDNMSAKINNASTSSEFLETMHLYSGDVFGIGFIMQTLGIYNSIIPPNASALIFDLRYKKNDFLVTVSYKNSSSDKLYLLTTPHCNPICKFTEFVNITNDLMLENWDSYCETISIFDLTYTIPIVIFGLAIIFILTLIIVLLVVKCCKNLRKKKSSFS